MLSMLVRAVTHSTVPSAFLALYIDEDWIHILHVLPENGTIEEFSHARPHTPYNSHGAVERSREQIGTVTLRDREASRSFFRDIRTRIRKLQAGSGRKVEVAQLVQDILRPAALEAIHERGGQGDSVDEEWTYPLYVVYIRRHWTRKELVQMTSFP